MLATVEGCLDRQNGAQSGGQLSRNLYYKDRLHMSGVCLLHLVAGRIRASPLTVHESQFRSVAQSTKFHAPLAIQRAFE